MRVQLPKCEKWFFEWLISSLIWYIEILKILRVYPGGIYSSVKIYFFLQSVPLKEQWSKIFDFFMTDINSIAHYKTCQVGRIVPLTSICQKSKKASLQVSQKRDPVSQMLGQLSGIGDQVFWMGDLVFPNGGQIYSCR